jgi:hypothetical protein
MQVLGSITRRQKPVALPSMRAENQVHSVAGLHAGLMSAGIRPKRQAGARWRLGTQEGVRFGRRAGPRGCCSLFAHVLYVFIHALCRHRWLCLLHAHGGLVCYSMRQRLQHAPCRFLRPSSASASDIPYLLLLLVYYEACVLLWFFCKLSLNI